MLHRGFLAGIKKKIIFNGQLAVLKHNCRFTVEHGGERCVNMERESVQFPGEREGDGRMDERCYAHMCSAIDFQLFPEQRWPNLQQWWETAIGTCTKVSFSGGPSRCVLLCAPWLGDCRLPNAGKFFPNQNLVLS